MDTVKAWIASKVYKQLLDEHDEYAPWYSPSFVPESVYIVVTQIDWLTTQIKLIPKDAAPRYFLVKVSEAV